MATTTRTTSTTARPGTWSVGFGLAAVTGLLWTWAVSVLPDLNPPGAVRIPLILLLPVGVVGAVVAGVAALRGPGRRRGVVGMALAGATTAAFVVLAVVLE